ncbi:unnamed protein product [Ectocarpus sp. 12 AP-2014]
MPLENINGQGEPFMPGPKYTCSMVRPSFRGLAFKGMNPLPPQESSAKVRGRTKAGRTDGVVIGQEHGSRKVTVKHLQDLQPHPTEDELLQLVSRHRHKGASLGRGNERIVSAIKPSIT